MTDSVNDHVNERKKASQNSGYWFIAALVCGVVGFFVGMLAVVGAGGASGSGCGKDCMNLVETSSRVASGMLTFSMIAALVSITLTWRFRRPRHFLGVDIIMTILNALVILVDGPVLAFMVVLAFS